jgi:hypothetical protein
MSTIVGDIEKLAFNLPVNERAKLADRLIASLPEDFTDEEEIDLALTRDREMDEDPSKVISHQEFFQYFKDRRKG